MVSSTVMSVPDALGMWMRSRCDYPRLAGQRSADGDKACFVVLHVVDALGENIETVAHSRLLRADGSKALVALFLHVLGRDGGVRHLDGLQIVRGNEAVALRQRMRMRADTLDILELGAGTAARQCEIFLMYERLMYRS